MVVRVGTVAPSAGGDSNASVFAWATTNGSTARTGGSARSRGSSRRRAPRQSRSSGRRARRGTVRAPAAVPARGRWPRMCTATNATQAMKLTLCSRTSGWRELGPRSSSATPVASMASVDSTTSGASPRSSGCGAPLRRSLPTVPPPVRTVRGRRIAVEDVRPTRVHDESRAVSGRAPGRGCGTRSRAGSPTRRRRRRSDLGRRRRRRGPGRSSARSPAPARPRHAGEPSPRG